MKHARDESLPNERWLPVVGYEGWYDVSDHGRVRRMKVSTNTWPGKILRTAQYGNRYVLVSLSKNNVEKTFCVHHLVAYAFIGDRPEGLDLNHIDGNKLNNALSNLEYVTHSENTKHAFRIGLKARGEGHNQSKLTENEVFAIRKLYPYMTNAAIARMFSVAASTVYSVASGDTWAWLKEE